MLRQMLDRLTDNYAKDPDSRIGKLMRIFSEQLKELGETFQRIEAWRAIDEAEGATLDRIGRVVLQPRGAAKDEVYRILLKSKIARNLSTADINTIISVLAVALDVEPSEIKIEEMYNDPFEPEPAAIKLIQLPIKTINEAGMDPHQMALIVQRTVAAGVRVGIIELTGTFQFSSQEPVIIPAFDDDDVIDDEMMLNDEYTFDESDNTADFLSYMFEIDYELNGYVEPEIDPDAGFSDDEQETGGYFGYTFSPETGDLPI